MKILYIGHYREGGGWAKAATDYIQALNSIGLDVVCRNVSLTGATEPVPDKILELEQKSIQDVDYCIQNVLPHHLVGSNKFKKNIAIIYYESTSLKHNPWIENLKLMDEVWVANKSTYETLKESGLPKIRIVHNACDLSKFDKEYPKLSIPDVDSKFKFYFIGDLNDRKNIEGVLRCFHSEFCNKEPVCLVIKINKFGMQPQALKEHFIQISNKVKQTLRISANIKDHCKEVIVSEKLTEDQLNSIHATCDCFVTISHGEGWSIPSFDAMGFGKTPICSKEGGPQEFIDEEDLNTGTLVGGVYGVCSHTDPVFPHIFTGREEWFVPSEAETKARMRYYYEQRDNIDRSAGLKQVEKFSYKNIANQIKEHLSE